MLLQTNSYVVPEDRKNEHSRLVRRFRQTLARLGCEHFEVYEQVGANWTPSNTMGRYVQIMRFRDRRHQMAVQAAERSDPGAQALIEEFCNLINFPYQQEQGLFAVGFYASALPVVSLLPEPDDQAEPEDVSDSEARNDEDEIISEPGLTTKTTEDRTSSGSNGWGLTSHEPAPAAVTELPAEEVSVLDDDAAMAILAVPAPVEALRADSVAGDPAVAEGVEGEENFDPELADLGARVEEGEGLDDNAALDVLSEAPLSRQPELPLQNGQNA